MRLEELAFFSDLDFLSCVFLARFLLKARGGEKYWLLYFFCIAIDYITETHCVSKDLLGARVVNGSTMVGKCVVY